MTEPIDEASLELQREYLSELPQRLDEIRADVAAFRSGSAEAAGSLKVRFHRLAGSGGSYGFPEISRIAREHELWMGTAPPTTEAGRLDQALGQLAAVQRRLLAGLTGTPAVTPVQLRASLILPSSPEQEQLSKALRKEGFEVGPVRGPEHSPGTAATDPLDLLVIGTSAGEGDPSAIASIWTRASSSRPRAVVLIETLRAVNRLRAIAAGVDAVVPAERMVEDVPRYARTLARSGPPPRVVLLVESNPDRAATVGGQLEEANVRVVRCHLAQSVPEILDREVPDLLLLAVQLADSSGEAVARLLRRDPRLRFLPILFLGPGTIDDQIAALRAGGDDFLPFPVSPALLVETVVVRAERSRRLRETLHRDHLTGLLNQVTLLAELDYAADHVRRHGGALTFVVFDLDRFHEVNERFGSQVGDQVLLHVANVFRANVRASDVIGRYGGEEFAMVLPGVTAGGAAVLAAKLRRVLGEQSASTQEGIIIPLHVSVGWSCFPTDGTAAGELTHAAVRALQKDKSEK
ncbi:MAG TPA: diguanylate cyclase [Gemmatimonadales bacterium]|jgi:diguanylate cyclase (GGDEF)-like protein|nr:diguanylate cyclase [Gemmatimonadales bacterium]